MKAKITVTGTGNKNKRSKKLIFNRNVPLRSCIKKIDNTFICSAEDLDIVVLVYNLWE